MSRVESSKWKGPRNLKKISESAEEPTSVMRSGELILSKNNLAYISKR